MISNRHRHVLWRSTQKGHTMMKETHSSFHNDSSPPIIARQACSSSTTGTAHTHTRQLDRIPTSRGLAYLRDSIPEDPACACIDYYAGICMSLLGEKRYISRVWIPSSDNMSVISRSTHMLRATARLTFLGKMAHYC